MSDDTDDGMEQLVNEGRANDREPDEDHGAEDTGGDEADAESDGDGGRPWEDDADLRRKLNYALLAGLSLLAVIAALQFYLNASAAISQWVTREYRSLFQAVFNLAVLLVAAAGISRQVRRLTA